MAQSFLSRAYNKLGGAKGNLDKLHYPESISASQECIELSIKSIFLLFKEKEFEKTLEKIPEEIIYLDFPKLYLYSKLWESFYTVAKYGFEKLGVGADKLFEKEEANLAYKHSGKCRTAANILKNHIYTEKLKEILLNEHQNKNYKI